MPDLIQTINHGPIRELQLARPPVNALNDALCVALIESLQHAFADDVAGVVLSGNDKVFSGGLDVLHLLSHGKNRQALHATWSAFLDVARTIVNSPTPIAAALTGHAPAGGCVLALCCDYRVMCRSQNPTQPLQIGLNETQVGLVIPDGIQHLMRRVIGAHRATLLLVPGAMVSAEHALQIGLIDALEDNAQTTVQHAIKWLKGLARLPQTPLKQTRAIARADLKVAIESIVLDDFIDSWFSKDTQAAMQAVAARLTKQQ